MVRQEEGMESFSFAGMLFPKGDVIASLARRVCFLPQGAWTGESGTWVM